MFLCSLMGFFFFGGSWWICGFSGGFTSDVDGGFVGFCGLEVVVVCIWCSVQSGVDGGFLGFCRLDVVVVRVWCSGGGDYGVAAMVDRQLLWFWVSFFSFLFFFFVGGCWGVWWWWGGGCLGGFR